MEAQLIKKIKGGIFGIKNGTKQPSEIAKYLNMLKDINKPMYEELLNDYKAAIAQKK